MNTCLPPGLTQAPTRTPIRPSGRTGPLSPCLRPLLAAAALASLLAGAPAAASTTLLDFSGNICGLNGNQACGNGTMIGQNYGDIPNVLDVIWDSDRATAAAGNILHWGSGYESLLNVGYGTNGGGGVSIVFLLLEPGWQVTLNEFDIAPFSRRERNSVVRVFDLGSASPLLDTGLFSVPVGAVTSYANPGNWTSTTGLRIEFGPDAWDVGISNISFTTQEVTTTGGPAVIPLPPAGLLLLGGLMGLAALRRRA